MAGCVVSAPSGRGGSSVLGSTGLEDREPGNKEHGRADEEDAHGQGDLAHIHASAPPRRRLSHMGSRPGRRNRRACTPTSASCAVSTAAGAPVSGSEPEAVFGNAITSRIESRLARIATIRSMPSASPPCGGAPYLSASSRKPKRDSRLLLGDPERGEHLLLDLGAVDTDRPAADLRAVEHDVVGARAQRARILEGAGRRRERVVQRVPALLVRVPLEHREVDDPQQLVAALGDQVVAARDLQPQLAQATSPRRSGCASATISSRSPGLASQRLLDGRAILVAERLRDRRAPRAALLHDRPHQPAGAVALDDLGQLVGDLARRFARTRVEAADHAAALQHALEHAELGVRDGAGEVGDLHPEAQVRLVGAVLEHRLV